MTLRHLGSLHLHKGDLAGAEEHLTESLCMTRAVHGEDAHLAVPPVLEELASCLMRRGRAQAARGLIEEALQQRRAALAAILGCPVVPLFPFWGALGSPTNPLEAKKRAPFFHPRLLGNLGYCITWHGFACRADTCRQRRSI